MLRQPLWKWLLRGCSAYLLAVFLFAAFIVDESDPLDTGGCWNGDGHRGRDTCIPM